MKIVGKLLIAPPAVKGTFWHKTVIAVTEHHAQGSVGFVLNRRSQMTVKEFGEQLGVFLNLPGYIYYDVSYNNQDGSKTHCRYAKKIDAKQ